MIMADELDTDTSTQVNDPGQQTDSGVYSPPGLNPKAVLQQQIADRMDGIRKKYEAQSETLRSVSMPDEGSLKEEMAADLASLRKKYQAQDEDVWSSGPEVYHKKQAALMASYHADQFDIQQKHEKQLRQMNRAYDQQKGTLQRQQEGEVAEVEKRALYDAGNMHAYELAGEHKLMSPEDVYRAQCLIAGIKIPGKPKELDPNRQFMAIEQVRSDIEGRLKKFSMQPQDAPTARTGNRYTTIFGGSKISGDIGTKLMVVEQTDPTDPSTKQNRPATQDEMTEWGVMSQQLKILKAKQVSMMESQGLLPKSARNAYDYIANKGLMANATGMTKRMDESMKSPPKTQAPKPVKSINSEDPLGWN
jgi:hypothetical protein